MQGRTIQEEKSPKYLKNIQICSSFYNIIMKEKDVNTQERILEAISLKIAPNAEFEVGIDSISFTYSQGWGYENCYTFSKNKAVLSEEFTTRPFPFPGHSKKLTIKNSKVAFKTSFDHLVDQLMPIQMEIINRVAEALIVPELKDKFEFYHSYPGMLDRLLQTETKSTSRDERIGRPSTMTPLQQERSAKITARIADLKEKIGSLILEDEALNTSEASASSDEEVRSFRR